MLYLPIAKKVEIPVYVVLGWNDGLADGNAVGIVDGRYDGSFDGKEAEVGGRVGWIVGGGDGIEEEGWLEEENRVDVCCWSSEDSTELLCVPAKSADRVIAIRKTTETAPPIIQVLRFTPTKPFASSVFEEDCSEREQPSRLCSIGIVMSSLLASFAFEGECS
jgi:hypothetical protein